MCWVAWDIMTQPKHLGGLGFRDIELFNLALLARQAWRILMDPNSLSARILKAKYFPQTDFLQAEVGSAPSQVWRAIVEGKDVLAQGLIRRIGNGATTHIWRDNWLPRERNMRPITSLQQNPPQLVHELISHATGDWNRELIHQTFIKFDADAILSIPICNRPVNDFWAWSNDSKGVFSVRSAYRMLVSTKLSREAWLEGRGEASNTDGEQKAWCSLWKTQVPSKLKIFL